MVTKDEISFSKVVDQKKKKVEKVTSYFLQYKLLEIYLKWNGKAFRSSVS